jgi:hypothetical protein
VIEVGVPDLQHLPFGATVRAFDITADHLGFDEYNVVTQSLISHHLYPDGDGWRRGYTPLRYVWPSELDLMARIAGMTFVERWQDWDRTEFTTTSTKQISVWQKVA